MNKRPGEISSIHQRVSALEARVSAITERGRALPLSATEQGLVFDAHRPVGAYQYIRGQAQQGGSPMEGQSTNRQTAITGKLVFCKNHLAIVLVAILAAYQPAHAQEPLHLPSSELSIPGVAQKSPVGTPAINGSAFADFSSAQAAAMQFKDAIPHTRSAQDVSLFRQVAPSVVLILTKDAVGSGSLLQNNVILTNFHVLDHNREVTVVFKPAALSGKASVDEVVKQDSGQIPHEAPPARCRRGITQRC